MILKYVVNNNITVKFYKTIEDIFTDFKQKSSKFNKNDINSIILLERNGNNNYFSNLNGLIAYCKTISREGKASQK